MSDWDTMFGHRSEISGSPVKGDPDEFQAAGDFFADMHTASSEIVGEFERLLSDGGATEFQGETAVAFSGIVDNVKGSLDELPRVSGEAAGFLHGHVTSLNTLRDWAEVGAQNALSRAQAHWDKMAYEDINVINEGESANAWDRKIWPLAPRGEDPADDQNRTIYERNRDQARARQNAAQERHATAFALLDAVGDEWIAIRDEEDRLSQALDEAIDDIKLGALSDPKGLNALGENFADFVSSIPIIGDLVNGIYDFVAGLVSGDWAQMLHGLSKALGAILTIAAVVALFTPIGPFAAALLFAAALTKFAADAILYETGAENPRTGETVSGADLAFSAIGVVAAGGGYAAASANSFARAAPGAVAGSGGTSSTFGNAANGLRSFGQGSAGVSRGAQFGQAASDIGNATSIGQTQWDASHGVRTRFGGAGSGGFGLDGPMRRDRDGLHGPGPATGTSTSLPGSRPTIRIDGPPSSPIVISVDDAGITVNARPARTPAGVNGGG